MGLRGTGAYPATQGVRGHTQDGTPVRRKAPQAGLEPQTHRRVGPGLTHCATAPPHPPVLIKFISENTENLFFVSLWLNLHLSFGHHHGLTLMEQAESWDVARLYCRMYFVDLAAAHTESQLGPLIEVAKAVSGKIWIGLHYSGPTGWSWVDGQVLSYNPWKKENKLGRCGTIDTRLSGDKKLLQRICMEHRPFICQGEPAGNVQRLSR
uniref:C-type lectin domain-containing protein n=1 Tax=Scleropages formosus TaxID=113540 RepID=A0A8C9RNH8_SCLFO